MKIRRAWKRFWREVRYVFQWSDAARRLARWNACRMNDHVFLVIGVEPVENGFFVHFRTETHPMVLWTDQNVTDYRYVRVRYKEKPEQRLVTYYGREYLLNPSTYLTIAVPWW